MTDSERPSEKAGTPVPNDQSDEHVTEVGKSTPKKRFFNTNVVSAKEIARNILEQLDEDAARNA